MGNGPAKYTPAKTFFQISNHISSNTASKNSLKEQIKLSFELTGCDRNSSYSFEVYDTTELQVPLGKSEVLTPDTTGKVICPQTFVMNYYFELEQKMVIYILKNGNRIDFNTTLGTIVGSRNCTLVKPLEKSPENISINAVEIKDGFVPNPNDPNSKAIEVVTFDFQFEKNPAVNFGLKKNMIFYKVFCQKKILYQSDNVSEEGRFKIASIPTNLLAPNFSVEFVNCHNKKVYEIQADKNDFITEKNKQIEFTLHKKFSLKATNMSTVKLIEESQLLSTNESNFRFTFLDYLSHGVQINLTIAIDFTGSNGSPTSTTSLHYIAPNFKNDYERVIEKCGNIVAKYDYDQLFPVYGFGGVPPGKNEVSMCFPLNGQSNPEIKTIETIVNEYRIKCPKIQFSGPTKFSPVIKEVINTIKEENNKANYQILMILTDGEIHDMPETTEQLIIGSELPLSVIIVGIGGANFHNMDVLDADDNPLTYRGKTSKRDLVQFVPFRNFKNDEVALSREVLEELPRQILEYYDMQKITPYNIKPR